jgi:segregation and condensation protein B
VSEQDVVADEDAPAVAVGEPGAEPGEPAAVSPEGTDATGPAEDASDEGESSTPPKPKVAPLVDPAQLAGAVEAILFVVEAPVTVTGLAAALQQPTDAVAVAVEDLRRGYEERNAGVEVREVAGGVRIYTRPDFAAQVEVFLQDGQRSRLTQAALETLAVIAYRQPVTRSRVSAIRGVNVDGVVRTLSSRGLIVEVGSDPDTGGGLFRTTELFLEKMGLESLDQLPSLAPLLPDLDGLDSDEL